MEKSDDDSFPSATVNSLDESSPCHRHRRRCPDSASSADVITRDHTTGLCLQRVTQPGDVNENLVTCPHHSGSDYNPRGPMRSCSDVRETSDDQGGLPNTGDNVDCTSNTDSTGPNRAKNCLYSDGMPSCTEGSKVNPCHGPDGLCGGGATGSTDRRLDDLPEVSSDDKAFMAEPPPGRPCHRNTFERSRGQSALGDPVQEEGGGSESELQSRRPGIVEFLGR